MTRDHAEPRQPTLRRDARRNLEKIKAAALEIFHERGLDAPLEEIAQRAAVSTGTIYNRFGSRDALIDAVVPDLAAARLGEVLARTREQFDPWQRFTSFVGLICELQAGDPTLNDVVTRRYPNAERLTKVCDDSLRHAAQFIDDAQRDGSLRTDFTSEDLFVIFWSNAMVLRATTAIAPDAWRRSIAFVLDGLHAGAANPLPVGPDILRGARDVLLGAG